MNVVGLFSGIGGLELSFKGLPGERLLCESWRPAQAVLEHRFPNVEIWPDVTTLRDLPTGTDVVTAGFPCTDLSQAGRTAGIKGTESGLVASVFRLLGRGSVETVVLENVRNMLVLDKGRAMRYLTKTLESLGYSWAYRLVDSRCTGVPQRRHRVILVACRDGDPRRVLFADQEKAPADDDPRRYRDDAYGFYWTEGLTGLGWARDAVPPLKGGSSFGIPSPPAIWLPGAPPGEAIRMPSVEAAERLQGFPAGWTRNAETVGRASNRWKLVGNAVSAGIGKWLGGRLRDPGSFDEDIVGKQMTDDSRWPGAAYGKSGRRWPVNANHWPKKTRHVHLRTLLYQHGSTPLSERATRGFSLRIERSRLNKEPKFDEALQVHLEASEGAPRSPAARSAVDALSV